MTFEGGAQNIYWRKAALSINDAGKSDLEDKGKEKLCSYTKISKN